MQLAEILKNLKLNIKFNELGWVGTSDPILRYDFI